MCSVCTRVLLTVRWSAFRASWWKKWTKVSHASRVARNVPGSRPTCGGEYKASFYAGAPLYKTPYYAGRTHALDSPKRLRYRPGWGCLLSARFQPYDGWLVLAPQCISCRQAFSCLSLKVAALSEVRCREDTWRAGRNFYKYVV